MSDADNVPKVRRDERGRLLPGSVLHAEGRPKSLTMSRKDVLKACVDFGYNPIAEMIKLSRETQSDYVALQCHKAVAEYILPKVKQIQITNADGDSDGVIRISWDTSGNAQNALQAVPDAEVRQLNRDMKNATQKVLDGVAEAVIEDDDED